MLSLSVPDPRFIQIQNLFWETPPNFHFFFVSEEVSFKKKRKRKKEKNGGPITRIVAWVPAVKRRQKNDPPEKTKSKGGS
jgi:hypothetical protein